MTRGREDWDSICELGPRTDYERERCIGLGYLGAVDSYAATEDFRFQKVDGKMGPRRSQLFTWTTKVHAPSWSMPAVGTCPSVCDVTKQRAQKPSKIPRKCLGCYAFKSGKYGTPLVEQAMHRRWGWFDSRSEDDVVEDMAKAIRIAGREDCRRKRATINQPWTCRTSEKGHQVCTREDPVYCETDIHGTPQFFRIFDSGDFHDARSVRIWRRLAQRFPRTKFWAPTTAWVRHDRPELLEELGKLARMKNVILRPSGLLLDAPAVHVDLGGVTSYGSTVLNWGKKKAMIPCPWVDRRTNRKCERLLKVLPAATTMAGKPVVYDPTDDATLPEKIRVRGVEHYLCRGDCAKCRRCWEKGVRVAYVQHGPSVGDKKKELKRAKLRSDYLDILFPQYKDLGPEGATEHPARRYLRSRMLLDSLEAEQRKREETRERKRRLKEAAERMSRGEPARAVAGLDTRAWRNWR